VGGFSVEIIALLEQHAAAMSRVLRIALRLHGAEIHPDHLRAALKSRAVVDAAVSLIMLQQHGGREGALEVLQLAAKSGNRRMQDIATDIVRGAGLPGIQRDGGQE
jgi:AmiR/NasT family two-component response regulator